MEKDKLQLTEVCRVCANKIKDKKRQRHIFNYLRGKLLQNLKLITGVEVSKLKIKVTSTSNTNIFAASAKRKLVNVYL